MQNQSNHHQQQTNIHFLQAGCPSCCPTNSVKALKGKISRSMDLLTPSSPGGLPTLSLTTNSSWLPWGRVANISHQPSDASTPFNAFSTHNVITISSIQHTLICRQILSTKSTSVTKITVNYWRCYVIQRCQYYD